MKIITLNQFKEVLNYLLDNNAKLVEQGQTPIAIGISGVAGIGKTAIVQQIANTRNMTLCKLNLAQLEEVGDLCGFPIKEYKVINGNEVKWVSSDILPTIKCDTCTITGEHRMGYAAPAWLPKDENPNGTILFLDDFTRANALFLQALMELINCGTYMTWSLPKNTTIVLSENPDDGNYQVNTMDPAMRTRYISFDVEFDLKEWANWAEFANIDTRAINFALMHGDEIFKNNNNNHIINPRSYVTFCKAIGGIKNWSDTNSLAFILQLSKGCFIDENNVIGNLFTMFINNNLDKLISPEDLLNKNWKEVSKEIEDCVYVNDVYRQDIASILSIRLLNYSLKYMENKGDLNKVQDRLLEILNNEKELFTEDLLFNIIKTLIISFPGKASKLLMNERIRSKIV